MRALHPQDPASTYAAVLDALPIVAWMANPDGVVTYLSRGWEKLTGNSAREVLEQGYHVVIHPADLPRVAATWDAARAAESSYRDEVRIRLADGAYHATLSQAEPMRGHGGAIIGWFGTLTDIRDRTRAEAALAESESTFRALSATIPGVTWAASPAGDLNFVGERWTSLHGKPREDALGESWLESVHPDDRERVLGVWAHSLSTGEPYDIEFRLRVVDGTYRWFLVRALPVRDQENAIVRWVGVNVDIDDQHIAYEQAHRIAMTFQDASLPKTLPILKGLRLSADYRPGSTETTIGGDWYDAFLLVDGRLALTIGDVLGNGLAAAVTMGKVRQAMRAAAALSPDPDAMLDVADRTIRDEADDTYATALAAIYNPNTGQFIIASAGHAGPAVRHADGRIDELAVEGMMLGLRPMGATGTVAISAPPGSSFVFFTDGLVEATRDVAEGLRRLYDAMQAVAVTDVDNPAHALVEHVLRGRAATDDVAVLIADVAPSAQFDAHAESKMLRPCVAHSDCSTVLVRV